SGCSPISATLEPSLKPDSTSVGKVLPSGGIAPPRILRKIRVTSVPSLSTWQPPQGRFRSRLTPPGGCATIEGEPQRLGLAAGAPPARAGQCTASEGIDGHHPTTAHRPSWPQRHPVPRTGL